MSVKRLSRLYEQLSVDNSSPPITPTSTIQGTSFHQIDGTTNPTMPEDESTIVMSKDEFDKYNHLLSSKEIQSLGMSSMELEAEKRGQRWRNLSYHFFKNHHKMTDAELQTR